MNDLISRQAVITEFSCCELTPDGGIDANYAIQFLEQMPSAQRLILEVHSDIYHVICAQRDVAWRIYQSNKKMDPSGSYTMRMFHEWLTLDSTARLFTDPVELETIKEIYHLNEEE